MLSYYKIGTSVGDTTAGCNGVINNCLLNGGYSMVWTGMKVTKRDDSPLYLNGFSPNYPIKRTIKAVKENRDEYLDKALEILRK
jgi:hypothetical protein